MVIGICGRLRAAVTAWLCVSPIRFCNHLHHLHLRPGPRPCFRFHAGGGGRRGHGIGCSEGEERGPNVQRLSSRRLGRGVEKSRQALGRRTRQGAGKGREGIPTGSIPFPRGTLVGLPSQYNYNIASTWILRSTRQQQHGPPSCCSAIANAGRQRACCGTLFSGNTFVFLPLLEYSCACFSGLLCVSSAASLLDKVADILVQKRILSTAGTLAIPRTQFQGQGKILWEPGSGRLRGSLSGLTTTTPRSLFFFFGITGRDLKSPASVSSAGHLLITYQII